jgi:hypothetical protein
MSETAALVAQYADMPPGIAAKMPALVAAAMEAVPMKTPSVLRLKSR